MKSDARQFRKYLAGHAPWRFVLLHGDDAGLIRELAAAVVSAVAGSQDDPFRVAVLTREDQSRLPEEASALSLDGGRRVVRVREATDALLADLQHSLEMAGDTVIVVEGGALPARSKLRALAEKRQDSVSVGCYPEEGRALGTTISSMFSSHKIRIGSEAMNWLLSHLGADRSIVRSEVEKLVLFAGEGGELTIDDVREAVGDSGAVSLEDAAFHAMEGTFVEADMALQRAFLEGNSPIAVSRALLSHISRLRRASALIQSGLSRSDAMKALKPPVFFKRTQAFGRALDLWPLADLEEAGRKTQALELACKQSGAPDVLLCQRHITVLAFRAASAARRHRRV